MNKYDKYFIYLLLLAGLLFISNLGSSYLFDWDEINFAEAAREMLVTNDFLTVKIDYQIFHEKPPLFFWLQAISMKIFGVNSFAARFPNAIIGILTLVLLYIIGAKEKSKEFGFMWAICYFGSILPFFYFKFGIIDPLFNLLIFVSIYLFYSFINYNHIKYLLYSSICAGAAILTKGPVALLIIGLTISIFCIYKKDLLANIKYLILFTFLSIIPIAGWYLAIYKFYNPNIFIDFWEYQLRLLNTEDAGHGGAFWFHLPVVLFGCFPASFLAIAFLFRTNKIKLSGFNILNIILFLIVLIIFSIVKTKIVHYSSLCYYPITFFAALYLFELKENNLSPKAFLKYIVVCFSLLLGCCVLSFPHVLVYIQTQIHSGNTDLIKDEFARELLTKPINWSIIELISPFAFFIVLLVAIMYLIKKKYLAYFYSIFVSISILIFIVQSVYSQRIEDILQGTIIDYLEFIKAKDNVYFRILGYKSYTQYFYGEKKQYQSLVHRFRSREDEENWLLKGNIDRTAYFICRAKDQHKYITENVILINSQHGYSLLKRYK